MRFEIFKTPRIRFFVLSDTFNIKAVNKPIKFIC
nr:MAG TPA: hypothetical protein [Caudoviricetes sp.]